MHSIQEKVDLLRDLWDDEPGLTEAETKCRRALLDICQTVADNFGRLAEEQEDLNQYIESIDADLSRIEDHIYGPKAGPVEGTGDDEEPYLDL